MVMIPGYLSCVAFVIFLTAGAAALLCMRTAFCSMSKFVKDGGRLKHIMDRGHTTKMHTYILICGNLGCYAVWAAATQPIASQRLPMATALAIIRLFQAMGELWNHSMHRWAVTLGVQSKTSCLDHGKAGDSDVIAHVCEDLLTFQQPNRCIGPTSKVLTPATADSEINIDGN